MNFSHIYSPYSSAHFDGFLVFGNVEAGWTTASPDRSPIVRFDVLTGIQSHPIYALDKLAVTIYSYCKVARILEVGDTQLQASFTCSWVSTKYYSNLIATHVEWHVSPRLRVAANQLAKDMESRKPSWTWPDTEIVLPGQRDTPRPLQE